jgi:nucleoside-diphosphate-sugar epimerase
MTRRAFVVGGTGQIGHAVARRLLRAGWEVDLAGRTDRPVPEGARLVRVDRDLTPLVDVVGEADVVVDAIAYERAHAEQLLALTGRVGSVVVVSSASVYADAAGRTLDEATGPADFPDLPGPTRERQRTVASGDGTYSTKKVAVERALLDGDALRATVIRPCAVHGPHSALPRELYFVKRILDGRRFVPLAYGGASRFHTTSVDNLAELVWLCAERPGRRVLNCGDPDPPRVLDIARTIAAIFEHEWVEVLLPGPPAPGRVGATPWSVPKPFVVDTTAAEIDLAYRPVTTYERAVRATCEWLVEATRERDWRDVLPDWAVAYLADRFDYAAEDEYLAGLRS